MMIATLRNHMGNTRFHNIFRWVWITIYWSSYGYHIVTVSRGFVSDADRNYASSDSWWLWCGKYQLKSVTFSAFISTLWTHNSSAAHPAKARPFLNLLCQYTPWAVTMSVTPSQYMQHFHSNFPNHRENVTLPYFENFQTLHSCFRPTYHANTHQGGLYKIMPYIGLCVRTRVRACVYTLT